MFCRGQAIGLAVFMFGTGLLLGSLLPSCLPVWLIACLLYTSSWSCNAACRKVYDRQSAIFMHTSEQFNRNLQLLCGLKQLILTQILHTANFCVHSAHVTNCLHNITCARLTLGTDHCCAFSDAAQSFTQIRCV